MAAAVASLLLFLNGVFAPVSFAQSPEEKERALARERAEIGHELEGGSWNARIHAVHRLEGLGATGVDLLERAADDADWQVRMTAVHYLGRAGEAGVPGLSRALEREPCRHVRLTALHWLGRIGEPAEAALRRALEDESGLVRVTNKYVLRKLEGRGGEPEPPGESDARAERALARSEDAQRCVSSPNAGRQRLARRAPAPEPPPQPSVVRTEPPAEPKPARPLPDLKPAARPGPEVALAPTRGERLGELDALLFGESELPARPEADPPAAATHEPGARRPPEPSLNDPLGLPEELAAVERAQRRRERLLAEARASEPEPRAGAGPELVGRSTAPRESFPPGPPGIGRAPEEAPEAGLAADAGTGKQERDPVPPLIALLGAEEPAKRARAADELGKLGLRATPAAAALRAALKDRKARVRASAALALGSLGEAAAAAVPQLVRALRDRDADVRASAAVALGRLPAPRARSAYRRHVRAEARALIEKGR